MSRIGARLLTFDYGLDSVLRPGDETRLPEEPPVPASDTLTRPRLDALYETATPEERSRAGLAPVVAARALSPPVYIDGLREAMALLTDAAGQSSGKERAVFESALAVFEDEAGLRALLDAGRRMLMRA